MSLAMSKEERETFLADVRIGILSLEEAGHGPLAVPVWYDYEAGRDLWFVTDRDSRKGRLLAEGRRISLCVQTEAPPYKYVSVEGPISEISPADLEAVTRPMARRYLGTEAGDVYIASTSGSDDSGGSGGSGGSIVVRMTPARWLTVDYAKR